MIQWFRNFFIPHENNNFAPYGLRKRAMVAMTLLVFLTFLGANLQALLWTSSQWMISTVLPSVIVDLTNTERAGGSLTTLRRSDTLDTAARLKAEDMARHEYFSHYSPSGVSPWHWFAVADYNFVHAGENLAIHFTDSSEVVSAWMNSPTHRDNILNDNYREIGVGTAEGTYQGHRTIYVVQLFGTPAVASASASPAATVSSDVATNELASPDQSESSEESEEVASESVSITEESVVIPPEPVPVEVEATESGVALYSGHISTSTNAKPAPLDGGETVAGSTVPYIFTLATQPNMILQIMYSIIALFVVGTLVASVLFEMRRRQPVQVAYSLSLLFLMAGLWSLHILVTGGALIA